MSTSIVKCRTQAQITPLGVDCETPMFSWQMAASRTGAKQSAYRIIVSKDKTMTSIIWNSNIVKSYIQHTALTADCTKLEPSTRYYWKVFVWDEENMMHESEGKIWNALNETEGLTAKQIKKATKLVDKDLFLGLGWLLREDKISTQEVEGELFVKLN